MKKIILYTALLATLASCKTQKVTWVNTTEANPWQETNIKTANANDVQNVIEIYPDKKMQVIDGFGACFNELGWTSLSMLTEKDRNSIMNEFFAPGAGAGFTLCRMPIAANDFARDWYSYNETKGDFAMKNFSIANDNQTLIPFIKAAQEHNKNLVLWASPWSPPQWMKYNGHYALNTVPPVMEQIDNGLREDQKGKEGTDMFIQQPEYFEAYALYFEKFIAAYKNQGINISMVMPQNEFNSAQWYPSCTWTPEGLDTFIKVLAPRMDKLGIKTFFGTLERPKPALFETVYDKNQNLIAGVGTQWAGKEAVADIHKKYPDLKIYQSEHECGNGENSWAYTEYGWDLMKHYFLNGAGAYMYWNISLKEGGLSRWGWKQNSLVTVNENDKTYKYTNDYYLMKHLSRYIQPGANLIETDSGITKKFRDDVLGWWKGNLNTTKDNMLAFANPDGSVAVVIYNDADTEKQVTLKVGPNAISPVLGAKSFNTFLFKK